MSSNRRMGRGRQPARRWPAVLGVLLIAALIAILAVMQKPSGGTNKGKAAATPSASASATAPSKVQRYFDGISKAIRNGDLHQQSLYVADQFRGDFVTRGVLMFPKGTMVTFKANTLVTDSPNTGGVKAVSTVHDKNGTTVSTNYVILLLKEKDASGHTVWHITDTEKDN